MRRQRRPLELLQVVQKLRELVNEGGHTGGGRIAATSGVRRLMTYEPQSPSSAASSLSKIVA